jgi:hypothetical protein
MSELFMGVSKETELADIDEVLKDINHIEVYYHLTRKSGLEIKPSLEATLCVSPNFCLLT